LGKAGREGSQDTYEYKRCEGKEPKNGLRRDCSGCCHVSPASRVELPWNYRSPDMAADLKCGRLSLIIDTIRLKIYMIMVGDNVFSLI
jgi:hypothetical protein